MVFIGGLLKVKFGMLTEVIYLYLIWSLPYVATDSEENLSYNLEPVCDRTALPEYPDYYIEGYGEYWNLARCPGGMRYDSTSCGCIPGYTIHTTRRTTRKPSTTPIPSTRKVYTTRRTTRKPSTTPIPSTRKALCDGCTFDKGLGYNRHNTECDKYIMCYPTGAQGNLTGETRQCGIGKYWDQLLLTCRYSKDVRCETERCLHEENMFTYKYESDCRGYWRCESGISVGHCCPKGQGFKDGFGCIPDLSCNTRCNSTDEKQACDKIPFPGDEKRFKQKLNGHGYIDMHCARGTIFASKHCGCETYGEASKIPKRVCRKELEMDFSAGMTDSSGSGVHVDSVNISLERGSACFNGNSALIIPRFANVEIKGHLDITMRYKFKNLPQSRNKLQALIFNGDCDLESSILVAANAHSTTFGLSNGHGKLKKVRLGSINNFAGWNDATFSLHRNVMKIKQNGRTASRTLYGSVARSRCGLKIGWGKGYESFNGCIDRISISFCPES